MKRLSQIKPLIKRTALLITAGAIALAGPAFAQNAAQPENGYPTFIVTGFLGGQWYQLYQGENARSHTFDKGIIWGERFTEDVHKYWGLEESLALGYNRLNIPVNGIGTFRSDTINTQVTANVIAYLTPRGSRFRPFLTFGPGYMWYAPRNTATVPAGVIQTVPLQRKGEPMFNYGIGLRQGLTKRFGVTYEVRATHSSSPKFGLPAGPVAGPGTLYLPRGDSENSIYFDVGLNYAILYHEAPIIRPVIRDLNANLSAPTGGGGTASITGGRPTVCRGDDLRLSATANGFGPSPTYQWLVNGQPAPGGTGTSFSLPTTNPGNVPVTVRVTGATATATAPIGEPVNAGDRLHAIGAPSGASFQWMLNGQPVSGATSDVYTAPGAAAANAYSVQISVPAAAVTSSAVTVNVLPLQPPTIQFAISPNTVPYGTRIPLAATASAVNECNGNVTVTYSGEGVTGTTLDTSAVSGLDMTNRLRAQNKQVTVTATARDARGQMVTATAPVTITLGTEATRLDDVVFQSMNSRVNNCGKRLLLETLTPMLRNDPGATVIFIGHHDERETGARGARLDMERVNNAAAIISAGKGICPSLDLSRIKVKAAGTDQAAQTRPALCGTSVTERSGAGVRANDDRAQFRRVEVWFVPSGAAMPPGITGLTDASSADITKLGCPR
jgi:outer membrane protein OmpA-like peptidoglycan-associated protein